MKKNILILFLLFACTGLFAQQFGFIEKTYEITGKAKRGSLVDVKYIAADGQYKLYYTIKSGVTSITLQIYTFDKDFNFIDMKDQVVEVNKLNELKAQNPFDFSWVNFKSDSYVVEGNTVEGNLVGTLVIKKKRTTYFYNWFNLAYDKKVEIL